MHASTAMNRAAAVQVQFGARQGRLQVLLLQLHCLFATTLSLSTKSPRKKHRQGRRTMARMHAGMGWG